MRQEDQIKLGTITTLDEPVTETIMRDLRQVYAKLRIVLLPIGRDSSQSILQKLREWDLWGPLLVCLLLSSVLSISAPSSSSSLVFATVFVIVWCGAALVTVNAQLLGGSISFFQSVCILGYCVFPLTLASISLLIISFFVNSVVLKLLFVGAGFVWSTQASVVFMNGVIADERRAIAVYPVFIFYTFIAWLIMLQ